MTPLYKGAPTCHLVLPGQGPSSRDSSARPSPSPPPPPPFLFAVRPPIRSKLFSTGGYGQYIDSELYLFYEEALFLLGRKLINVSVPNAYVAGAAGERATSGEGPAGDGGVDEADAGDEAEPDGSESGAESGAESSAHSTTSSSSSSSFGLPPPPGHTYVSLQSLYSLLPTSGVSLISYLAYAHLRSSGYTVLRHHRRGWKSLNDDNKRKNLPPRPPPLREAKSRRAAEELEGDAEDDDDAAADEDEDEDDDDDDDDDGWASDDDADRKTASKYEPPPPHPHATYPSPGPLSFLPFPPQTLANAEMHNEPPTGWSWDLSPAYDCYVPSKDFARSDPHGSGGGGGVGLSAAPPTKVVAKPFSVAVLSADFATQGLGGGRGVGFGDVKALLEGRRGGNGATWGGGDGMKRKRGREEQEGGEDEVDFYEGVRGSVTPDKIKLAAVSDGGTVLVFNFSMFSIPEVIRPPEKAKKEIR